MKRLLILSVFLIGGLLQVPASAMSFHESECKKVWEWLGGGDALQAPGYGDQADKWDVNCWDYVSDDGKQWIGTCLLDTSDAAD